jgi:hypothetical protein
MGDPHLRLAVHGGAAEEAGGVGDDAVEQVADKAYEAPSETPARAIFPASTAQCWKVHASATSMNRTSHENVPDTTSHVADRDSGASMRNRLASPRAPYEPNQFNAVPPAPCRSTTSGSGSDAW